MLYFFNFLLLIKTCAAAAFNPISRLFRYLLAALLMAERRCFRASLIPVQNLKPKIPNPVNLLGLRRASKLQFLLF